MNYKQFYDRISGPLRPYTSILERFNKVITRLYNRPRPYQTWDIQPLIKKDSLGKSFPSRHVFSATVIAMLALMINPWLGGTMLFLAAILAILRVLGGVHYPSDVLAGYVIGILVGLLLYL